MGTAPGLVGRQAELTQLSQILGENTGRAVTISGEAGVGKSALMAQVSAQAVAKGWLVVQVLGVEAEESFALGGLHQLVTGLKNVLADLDERDRATLAPASGADLDSSVSAMELTVAVLNLLTAAARAQPLLLLVDDMQWLDDVSATVLGAIGRRLAHQRVWILAGMRVPSRSKFISTGWIELALDPLDAESSEQLLLRSAAQLTAAGRAAVLTAAAGNPLALVELPRSVGQVQQWTAQVPLTERLVSVFGGRLEALDGSVRTELLRAALDGTTVSAPVTNQGRYEMTGVQQAVDAGLLIANPLGKNIFRHPLVRDAVIYRASAQERCDAHRYLAALYDDVLVRQATHLAAAATGPDQDVADLLARAAQMSVRQGGLKVASEWLRWAAELSTEPARRAALKADAVFFAARSGRLETARDISEGIGADDENSIATALANAYVDFHGRGEVIATHRQLIYALKRGGTLDDQTLNQLVQLLLTITNFAGDYERWQQTNDILEPFSARIDPAILLLRHRYHDTATTAEAVRVLLAERVPQLASLGPRDVNQLAFPAYCVDAMAAIRTPLANFYNKFREDGASIDAMAMGCGLMLDLMATGKWLQAEQLGAEGLRMAEQIQGGQLLRHYFVANLGVLAAWQGDLDAARRYAAELTEWAQPRSLGLYLDFALRITELVALAEADFETAYQAAVSICPPEQLPPFGNQAFTGTLDLIEAALHTGRVDEARTHVAVAKRLRIAEVSPRAEALAIAVSAMTAPDPEAGELYESALIHPGLADYPFEHARITLAQGMWLRRQRRHTLARDTLKRAAKAFDHLGARPWADRAQAEFRASAATGRPATERNAPLSPQERRIAELAGAGATTKQIAVQLTVSPRTVDTHLRNLYPKLGVTSRAALSEALRQLDSDEQARSQY